MSEADRQDQGTRVTRRDFMQGVLAAGAGLAMVRPVWAENSSEPEDQINVALIGAGSQGRVLMLDALNIPGIRFHAVVDVWPYSQRYASNILRRYEHPVEVYDDYREMLEQEDDLDAVLIASPDWVHAEQTIACLEAGLDVYCEKEMSNSLEDAKRMVEVAKETGQLLQIGHQRRSNPRYHHGLGMIQNDELLGRITHFYGQWNRSRRLEVGWPTGTDIEPARLEKLGYEDMFQFRNWRWFRKYSGGAMADLGSHQVDIFNWFLGAPPTKVRAMGGNEYYDRSEWYDHVMAIYEYPGPAGAIRGFYQVLNTTSYGDFYEQLMGDEGTLVISENTTIGHVMREQEAERRVWEDAAEEVEDMDKDAISLRVGASRVANPEEQESLQAEAQKPPHQLHLENFFNTMRDPDNHALTCPGEVGYETAVTVLKVNEAIESGGEYTFQPDEFEV